MGAKFKYGDKVVTQTGHSGKIVSVKLSSSSDNYLVTVKFDRTDLIPNEMDYPEVFVEFQNATGEVCPKCGERWTISKFNKHVWKDCKKCGKTSEKIIKEVAEKKTLKLPDLPDDDDDDFCFGF